MKHETYPIIPNSRSKFCTMYVDAFRYVHDCTHASIRTCTYLHAHFQSKRAYLHTDGKLFPTADNGGHTKSLKSVTSIASFWLDAGDAT